MEGTYEILGVIGRSGLGTLYRARYQGTGAFTKLVTLKRLDEGVADTDEVACRLRDEARVLGFLEHRTIVRIDNLVQLEGRWTLVLEHVDGVSLEAIIERGPVPTGPALEIVASVAGALHAAYTTPGPDGSPLRLQHRDVKPSAVLLDAYGSPRVTDFGIARACFTGREARTRSFVVGSFEYMSPERLALEEGGPWSDIYSLGQVLYALLEGHSFGRSHPSERHHEAIIGKALDRLLARPGGIDEGALELLRRMLALAPHERPDARSVERSCNQLARRLEEESLRSWAEQVVEPMLTARASSSAGGLVGRILRAGPSLAESRGAEIPDPSVVGARSSKPRPPKPQPAKPQPAKPQPTARSKARRELETMPNHSFSTPAGEEEAATEIMRRPEAGGGFPLDDPEGDSDATEMFTVPPGTRSPLAALEDPLDLGSSLDLGPSEEALPVYRSSAPSEPGEQDEPEPPETILDEDPPTVLGLTHPGDSLDFARPTVVQDRGDDASFDEELGQVERPTAVSFFSDELLGELEPQGPQEVTAVTPHEVSDERFAPFSLPVGSLDERTAIGPDIETARAERPAMPQVRFDLPAAAQDDRTLERPDAQAPTAEQPAMPRVRFDLPAAAQDDRTLERPDAQAPTAEQPAMPRVRFDLPAGSLDEHTALGEDIEAARAAQDEMAQVRFELPAGSLDEHTALGEDIEAARVERDGLAMPRVQFDAPETAAAPVSSLPPALEMPPPTARGGAAHPTPPVPAPSPEPLSAPDEPEILTEPELSVEDSFEEEPPAPLPPPFATSAPPPPPAEPLPPRSFEPPPPPPAEGPPVEDLEPLADPGPAAAEDLAPASFDPPPAPPPPPPPPALPVSDGASQSQAKPWSPGGEVSGSHPRPQLDFWEPPSADTLAGKRPPPAELLAAMGGPAASAAEARPVPEPTPAPPASIPAAPTPAAPASIPAAPTPAPRPTLQASTAPPAPTEGQDATVARPGARPEVAPSAPAPPTPSRKAAPARRGPNKLLLVGGVVLILGALVVALAVSVFSVWYFLL